MISLWRLLYAIPSWLLFTALLLPFMLIAFPLCALAVLSGAYKTSIDPEKQAKGENPLVYHFTWPFMFLWDNFEDGFANDMYWKGPNLLLQTLYWSCIRNPVNNLRITPYLSCKIKPGLVRWIGTFGNYGELVNYTTFAKYDTKVPHWFFCWHGLYSNFYWQFVLSGKLRRFWIGWKIFPTDVMGVTKYRIRGAGFALQFKVVK